MVPALPTATIEALRARTRPPETDAILEQVTNRHDPLDIVPFRPAVLLPSEWPVAAAVPL